MNISPLRLMREQRGWSLRELEKRAGISNAYLSQLEQGDRNPTLHIARVLAAVFNMPLDILFPPPDPVLLARLKQTNS